MAMAISIVAVTPGKTAPSGVSPRGRRIPEGKRLGRRDPAPDVGAEILDLRDRSAEAVVADGSIDTPGAPAASGTNGSASAVAELRVAPRRQIPWHEPQQPEPDEDAEKEEVVARGERDEHQGRDQQREPAPPEGLDPPMERQQHQREPVPGQQLEVRQMLGPERVEPVDQSRNERAPRGSESTRRPGHTRSPPTGRSWRGTRRCARPAATRRRGSAAS